MKLPIKKTYIVVVVAMVTAGLQAYGITIPDWVWPLLAAAGLGTQRAAVAKLQNSVNAPYQ